MTALFADESGGTLIGILSILASGIIGWLHLRERNRAKEAMAVQKKSIDEHREKASVRDATKDNEIVQLRREIGELKETVDKCDHDRESRDKEIIRLTRQYTEAIIDIRDLQQKVIVLQDELHHKSDKPHTRRSS